jgi:hypothetical protein
MRLIWTHAICTPDTIYTVIRFPIDFIIMGTKAIIFDVMHLSYDASAMVHLRSSFQISPDGFFFPPFPTTLMTLALNKSHLWWFAIYA